MSTYPRRDIERGMFSSARLHPHRFPYFVGAHWDGPPSGKKRTLLGESEFRDGSVALWALHSEVIVEEDNRMAEGWHKDADGILIFVSPHVDIRAYYYTHKFRFYRAVYSLQPWLRCLP